MKTVCSGIMTLFLATALWAVEPTVLIVYHSETGNTEIMAKAVEEGALSVEGVTVVLRSVDEISIEEVLQAGAIIVGSPVYNANVSPRIAEFIASWPFEGQPLKNKLGAAFVTAGGVSAGEEITQMNLLQSMLIFNMIVIGGPDWSTPFGASAIRGNQFFPYDEPIHPGFIEKGRGLGKRVAETLVKIHK